MAKKKSYEELMFPASAGMNRKHAMIRQLIEYVPRERGDEPDV